MNIGYIVSTIFLDIIKYVRGFIRFDTSKRKRYENNGDPHLHYFVHELLER